MTLRNVALPGFELLLNDRQRAVRLVPRRLENSGAFLQRPRAVVDHGRGVQDAQDIRLLLEVGRRLQRGCVGLAQTKIRRTQRLLDFELKDASHALGLLRSAARNLERRIEL
jgi:hypothetical protein